MSREKPKNKVIVWRVRLLQLSFSLFFGLIFCKTAYLQIFQANHLKKISDSQKGHSAPITLFRGEILDRNGIVLAIDTAKFDLYMRPQNYKASLSQISRLSQILNISEEKLENYAQGKNIIKLGYSLSRIKADSITKLKIIGLDLIPINQREYPQGKLAAHLLGFVSWDSSGQGGIEQTFNKALRSAHSESQKIITRMDGTPISRLAVLKPIISSSFGQQIVLTIDSKIQYKTEQILDENLNKFKAQRGTALIMSPQTGEILAWANSPSFNPNFYGQYSPDKTANWSISQVYEPGSTFKILTVASALQLKAIKPEFKYWDEGKLKVNNRIIRNHDAREGRQKEIGLVELFRFSSNTAAASIGLQMPPDKFHAQLKSFGIGERTGIEIPGESSGYLRDPKDWKQIDIATTSFGQGSVAVTPLQLASAINVIANKGEWIQPHLIKSILSGDGRKLLNKSNPNKRRVISARIAKQVSDLLAESIKINLEKDVSYLAGDIQDCSVAGKTGTAQKYCPNLHTYCPNQTIASFIGFFPAEQPQFLVLVVVDSPAGGGGWGNTVAGPIFNEIGSFLMKNYPTSSKENKKFLLF